MRAIVFMVSFLAPLSLYAQEAAATVAASEQAWWQVLVVEVIKIAAAIFVPVLSTLAIVLLRRWKINLEFAQVNEIAIKAAGWAEQKAATALKDGKPKTDGAEKMAMAMTFAKGMVTQYGLKKKATSALQDLIEANLGQQKLVAEPPA